jgi:hypothetical protein
MSAAIPYRDPQVARSRYLRSLGDEKKSSFPCTLEPTSRFLKTLAALKSIRKSIFFFTKFLLKL